MTVKPLYLLADSQLLFWRDKGRLFTSRILEDMEPGNTRAAYIGTSNGDDPQFYDLFLAAMQMIELSDCRMIPAEPSGEDREFLERAGLVLFSGGDVERGWRVWERNGLKDAILKKRYDATVMVGVSAGAVQLGLGTLTESPQPQRLDLFRFAPIFIGSHEEEDDWWNLRALVNLSQSEERGIGIPAGAGAVYHPDGMVEPVRKPLVEFSKQDGKLNESLLLPPVPAPLNLGLVS